MKVKKNILSYNIILLLLIVFVASCKSTKTSSNVPIHSQKKSNTISEQDQTKFTYYFIDACKERMKGNIEIAENLFKQCLKIDPSSSAVKYELGNLYRYNGAYDLAIKFAKECAKNEPKNEWYQLLYIECLHNSNLFSQAAEEYLKLTKNYPNHPEYFEGLASEYMYSGNYEKAYKVYEELEKQFGQNENFTLNKVKLLKELKKNQEVEIELKKLIQSNPREGRYYTYLAEFYQEINQIDKAFECYTTILNVDPKNPMIHLALADYYKIKQDKINFYKEIKLAFENPELEVETKIKILLSYQGLIEMDTHYKEQAFELCDIVLKLHPSSADAFSIYGDFLFKEKKLTDAKEAYLKSIAIDKSRFFVWNQLMFIESQLNDFSLLNIHSSEAMELFPNNAMPYFFNGFANIQLKKYEIAAQSLEAGIDYFTDNKPLILEYYYNLGNAYNAIMAYEKSDKAFDEALKVDPDNATILNNYAYYLSLRKDKLEKAEKFSRRSNELVPNNRSYIDTYGWILYQLKKYEEAEQWLSRASKMGNKNAVLLEHYGDVLFKLDKKEEAFLKWKEAKMTGNGSDFLDKKLQDKKLYE